VWLSPHSLLVTAITHRLMQGIPVKEHQVVAVNVRAGQTEASPAIGQGRSVRPGRLGDAFLENIAVAAPSNPASRGG
jgi:hypothetical protein